MIEIDDLSALKNQIGQEIGVSDWYEITQERINQFAEATDDRQWIHTDRRAPPSNRRSVPPSRTGFSRCRS